MKTFIVACERTEASLIRWKSIEMNGKQMVANGRAGNGKLS